MRALVWKLCYRLLACWEFFILPTASLRVLPRPDLLPESSGRCARRHSLAAASPFFSVNLFVTAVTPSTDLAALPAREICQLSGTDPVSVTTPRLTLM